MGHTTNRILTEQLGGRAAETFIAKPGELFYDFNTGVVKLGDGETPGGTGIAESSPLESLFIGPWVYFERPANQPEVIDKIADNLWITRNPDGEGVGSIYNSAPDPSEGGDPFNSNGGVSSPYGTEWNTEGWEDFSNTENRYYENLTSAWDGGGWATVKHNWIMHDTQNDKYYAIRFLTWDSGGNYPDGSFSYIRREINTSIYFSRADTDNQSDALAGGDQIATNLVINRGDSQAIFNYGLETDTRWTNFDSASFGATWYETGVVAIEWDTNADIDTALKQLKVGDEIYLDNNDGYATSTTISVAFNADTGTFTTSDVPPAQYSIPLMSMNLTKLFPIETDWNSDESPKGTLWNAEGYDDLSNLKSRQFVLFDDVFVENLGKRITGKELVMWDTLNDKYYAIQFTRWQQGNAGYDYPGFSYTRREINVDKLTAGLKFNDGTVQHTAYSQKIAGTLKQSPKLASTTQDRYITPGDIGKVIYLNGSTSTQYLRIADGGTADFPVGATVTIINRTGNSIYLYKDNDNENGTIYGAGTSDNNSAWTIPDNGGGNICTLMKIETGMDNFYNDWMLSGSNIVSGD